MKCYHSKWVPHPLDEYEKPEKSRSAHLMLNELDDHARTNHPYVFTGNESWMMHDQKPSKIWTLGRDHLDPTPRPSHHV
jgi:hypothetical protein